MAETLVHVDNLSRYFQNHCAIKQLSFSLKAGEVLGFLGPNGAGKSTTMQILTGNLAANEGQVIIAGFDIVDQAKQAKQHLGYLPEHPPVYRDASVDEYLTYCARLRRVKSAQLAKAVEHAKLQCALEQVGRRLIGNLSKGFQQRVGIAQAIIHNPPVVILDEPTVGLDPIQLRGIRDLVRSLGSQRSVILSTHILSEVQAICDRVQIIRQGELIYNASIEALNQNAHNSLKLSFSKAPSLASLEAIDGVDQVEKLEAPDSFRIYLDGSADVTPLVEQSVQQKWGLYELIPESQTLEELFIELTQANPKQPQVNQTPSNQQNATSDTLESDL